MVYSNTIVSTSVETFHLQVRGCVSLGAFVADLTVHMVAPNVLLQVAFLRKPIAANVAFVPFHGVVNAAMLHQVAVALESFVAYFARVLALLRVRSNVYLEAARLAERLGAIRAHVRLLLGVRAQVTLETARLHKRLVALVALEWFHIGMEAQMIDQV